MNLKSNFVFLFICLAIFISCGDASKNETELVTKSVSEVTPLNYAEGFRIKNFDSYKQIEVLNKGVVVNTYILYNEKSSKPSISIKNAVYVKTPVKNVAAMSSLYVGFLERLNLTSSIKAVDNVDYISNQKIIDGVAAKTISQLAIAGNINEELTIALHPDLIINYGSGTSQSDKNEKLANAGIPMVYCLDHLETNPLGRAEWIKLIACFYEKEKEADSLFTLTATNYLALKNEAGQAKEKPSVLTELKLNDAWYVPGGKSFMATLINDANGVYCWANDTTVGSLPLSFEQVYEKASGADYWLNVLFCKSLNDIKKLDNRYTNFKAFKNKQVFNNDLIVTPQGGNAYWETGLIEPDKILNDMIKILHPELLKEKSFNYYHQLN
jgi:iron complex transport system substrate-binding protein